MAELIDGALATGDNSFTPGQGPPVSRGASEPWDILSLDRNMSLDDNNNSDKSDNSNDMIDPALRDAGSLPLGGEDGVAGDNSAPPAVSGDFNEEAPVRSQKRQRAASDPPSSPKESVSGKKRTRTADEGHGCKPSNGHAMMAVSGSLDKVAQALMVNPNGPPSPERKTKAIKALKSLNTLTSIQKVRVLQLIRSDTSVADTFLAIEEDAELSLEFLLAEIESAST